MKEYIDRIRLLAFQEQFDEAIRLIQELESRNITSPQLKILKGIYLQLGESEEFSLEDAHKSYEEAIEIDENYVDAHVQLGWYLLRVNDDPEKAKSVFEKAIQLAKDLLNEARRGFSECERELRDK